MLFSNKRSVNIHLILKIKFLFIQLLEIIIVISVLNIGLAVAMSAKTNKQIEGTLPYVLFDGDIKLTTFYGFYSIKVPDDTSDTGYTLYITQDTEKSKYRNSKVNKSSKTEPIEVPIGTRYMDIKTLVPMANNDYFPNIDLADLDQYVVDDDGDKIESISPGRRTSSIRAIWGGIEYATILNRDNRFNNPIIPCVIHSLRINLNPSNYKYTINTKGFPATMRYHSSSSGNYYLRVKDDKDGFVCYAGPGENKDFQMTTFKKLGLNNANWAEGVYAHKVQNNNTDINFPTTGGKGLFFSLYLKNITVQEAIRYNGTTVLPISGDNSVKLNLRTYTRVPNHQTDTLQIELDGPGFSSSLLPTFKPTEFKLYADSNHTKILYSFKLERWYIHGNMTSNNVKAIENCNAMGYRLVSVSDLTNANYQDWNSGTPGNGNHVNMQLSYKNDQGWVGGLYNEWGPNIVGKGWGRSTRIMVTSSSQGHTPLGVKTEDGSISNISSSYYGEYICVSP